MSFGVRQIHEKLPVYGSGIREIQNKLQHLHVEVAEYSKPLTQDKRYADDKSLHLVKNYTTKC